MAEIIDPSNIDAPITPSESIDTPISTVEPMSPSIDKPVSMSVNPFDPSQDQINILHADTISNKNLGLFQNFNSSREYAHLVQSETGRQSVLNDNVDEQVSALMNNNLVSPELSSAFNAANRDDGIQSVQEKYLNYIQSNPDYIDQLNKDNPNLKLKSYNQIQQETLDRFIELNKNEDEVSKDNSAAGWIGRFLGSSVGFAQDPVGFIATVVPLGRAGATVLRTFAQMTGKGALTVAASELYNKPGEITVRRALGEDISTGQAIGESATTAAIGGLTIGTLGALGQVIGKALTKPVSVQTKAKLEEAQAIVKDVEDILTDKPDYVPQEQHDQMVAKAFSDAVNGRPIDGTSILDAAGQKNLFQELQNQVKAGKLTAEEANDIFDTNFEHNLNTTPFDNLTPTEEYILKNSPEQIQSDISTRFKEYHEQLKVKDQIIQTTDELGNPHTYSALEEFNKIQDDLTAQKEIATCLTSGVINVN